MSVAFSLRFTGNGINKNVSIAKDLITVFIGLKITAVRYHVELAFS